jgi:hypothetical protein
LHQFAPDSLYFRRNRLFLPRIAAVLAFSAGLGGCGNSTTPANPRSSDQAPSECVADGLMTVRIFGAIKSDIDWRQPDLRCEGMQRPRAEGARLRFAGELDAGGVARPLAFILSIPDLEQGKTASELTTRVTLIEEENARFFSTRESEICWSNITQQEPLTDSAGAVIANHYAISGLTYCVAPVAELNGAASVTLSDLQFTGQLHWAQE